MASCRCSPAASSTSARCSGSRFPSAIAPRTACRRRRRRALDWWRGFRSRELTALIEEAQTANFDIAVAIARIIQADAQSKIAGAPLLPAADFDASVTRSRPAGGPDRTTWRTAITASYEIDFWGKNRATSRAAQESAIAARFDRDTVAISTVVSVATAYFLVLASQDRLRIAQPERREPQAAC